MKKLIVLLALTFISLPATAQDMSDGAANFYKSDRVTAQKVMFKNQYDMKVAGNFFIPKTLNQNAKNPAIVVGHPMARSKSRARTCTPRNLPSGGLSPCPSICPSGARARGGPATSSRRTSMPRTSARRWTSWAPGPSSTGSGSASSGSAAAGASSSAPPRSTRA